MTHPHLLFFSSLCQRLGLTRSVRNKPRARSASIEHRRRESPPEAKDEQSESFAGGARSFAKLSPLHHGGANTIFLTNKKLSLDKRLLFQFKKSFKSY